MLSEILRLSTSVMGNRISIPKQRNTISFAVRYKNTFLHYTSVTFFALLTLTAGYGQGKEDKNYALLKIKKTFQEINGYKYYKTVTIDNSEDFLGQITDNGGSLTGYYKGDSLKKVVEWVGLSNKVIQNEYYYETDKLIFVYSTESLYRYYYSTKSIDYAKLDNVFKGRYYFLNGKLIHVILSDTAYAANKNHNIADRLTSSDYYLKLLKKKREQGVKQK